jgi:hypothetical protein
MGRVAKWILGGVIVAAVVGGAASAAVATGTVSLDNDKPLTGETRDRAVAAALDKTGGGEVTDTELGDDGASYSVEIQLKDGSQVEVDLDKNFVVTGQETDEDRGPND